MTTSAKILENFTKISEEGKKIRLLKPVYELMKETESVSVEEYSEISSIDRTILGDRVSVEDFSVVRTKTNYPFMIRRVEAAMDAKVKNIKDAYLSIIASMNDLEKEIEEINACVLRVRKERRDNNNAIVSVVNSDDLVYVYECGTPIKLKAVSVGNRLIDDIKGSEAINSALSKIDCLLDEFPNFGTFVKHHSYYNKLSFMKAVEELCSGVDVNTHNLSIRHVVDAIFRSNSASFLEELYKYLIEKVTIIRDSAELFVKWIESQRSCVDGASSLNLERNFISSDTNTADEIDKLLNVVKAYDKAIGYTSELVRSCYRLVE